MILLYLSDMNKSLDLFKAAGTPPGGVKPPSAPKTPGAATAGSGPQVVDCPLGAACPDGGRHQMGSQKLQEHTQQAKAQMQTGEKVGDESAGKESGKPGVPPGAANIGGVGSDQVKRVPPPVKVGDPDQTMNVADSEVEETFSAKQYERDPHGAKTRSYMQGHVEDEPQPPSPPPLPKKQSSGGQVAGQNLDRPGMSTAQVPNPLVPDEASVPPSSKPMDHYKLAQVARESGDEDLAGFHEGMARKRTEGMGSEDHRKLAEELHAEGMHDQAEYHRGIHQRVGELGGESKEETPAESSKHEAAMRDVHHEARTKANADLESAKKKHEETKAKAEKIVAANKEKLSNYEAAKAEYEKKKAEAKAAKDKSTVKKVGKPPEKPKLEKEEKVPERPDLYEPEDEADKLRHESHTSKAKRLAEVAESHLKGNKDLSDEQRKRLERAHKMAVYHSNVGYTPTAAHKKELGDIESAMSSMGVKENHAKIAAAEDAKRTAEAAKQAEKDRSAAEKQQAKQAKVEEKNKAAEAKQQAKLAGQQPSPPQTDLDHARVADHKTKAQELRTNLESHMANNPGMSPEEKAKAERIMNELQKHEQMEMVPGSAHESELKELQKLAGEHGKKPYEAETGDGEAATSATRSTFGNAGGYVLPMLHSSRALGAGLAAAATSPYGAAGQIGPQIVNYGLSGATTAGHRLLHDAGQAAKDEKDIQAGLDKEKDKLAKQAARETEGGNGVTGRGNQ